MSDPKKPESETKPSPAAAEKKAEAPETKKAPYVFKIVPADPKNAFDFEDVADK